MVTLAWLYLLVGAATAVSITLTHLTEAKKIRFWLSVASMVFIWPIVAILAYRQMWRDAAEMAEYD